MKIDSDLVAATVSKQFFVAVKAYPQESETMLRVALMKGAD